MGSVYDKGMVMDGRMRIMNKMRYLILSLDVLIQCLINKREKTIKERVIK